MMIRRNFVWKGGVASLCAVQALAFRTVGAQELSSRKKLSNAPLQLGGDWGSAPTGAVRKVLLRVREVCLSGLELRSDLQPEKLRVDNRSEGTPAIWLHNDQSTMAWIIVVVGPLAWCQLAYQFGHELGHVLCNSWIRSARPGPPTQWLEEAMVEAFSIRGLGLLAASWEKHPPFAGDQAYATAIRQYRDDLIEKYKKATYPDIASWFRTNRSKLESGGAGTQGPPVLEILAILESDERSVEDLGAANRWATRTRVPIEGYLANWEASCAEIGAAGRLPSRLRHLFAIG